LSWPSTIFKKSNPPLNNNNNNNNNNNQISRLLKSDPPGKIQFQKDAVNEVSHPAVQLWLGSMDLDAADVAWKRFKHVAFCGL